MYVEPHRRSLAFSQHSRLRQPWTDAQKYRANGQGRNSCHRCGAERMARLGVLMCPALVGPSYHCFFLVAQFCDSVPSQPTAHTEITLESDACADSSTGLSEFRKPVTLRFVPRCVGSSCRSPFADALAYDCCPTVAELHFRGYLTTIAYHGILARAWTAQVNTYFPSTVSSNLYLWIAKDPYHPLAASSSLAWHVGVSCP